MDKQDLFMLADRLFFSVYGSGLPAFFSAAASHGVRLRQIRIEQNGAHAEIWGRDWPAVRSIAQKGGWQVELVRRIGPGAAVNMLMRRTGIPVGMLLFSVLLSIFSDYIWKIEYDALEPAEQERAAAVLRECGVYEGARADADTLKLAQDCLMNGSDEYGWVSLNFTGGCLVLESTAAQKQSVRQQTEDLSLYAKADACVLTVETESGFSLVKPGQTVAEGQLLVRDYRLDRSEQPVAQSASGHILGRVTKKYQTIQPLQTTQTCLTGVFSERISYLVFGKEIYTAQNGTEPARYLLQTLDEPLDLFGLALPGCVQRSRMWELARTELQYSEPQAAALARRACWKDLYGEFPDAEIEASSEVQNADGQSVKIAVTATFVANIACEKPGETTQAEN